MIVLDDAMLKPELFVWNGGIGVDEIESYCKKSNIELPEDIRELWQKTGGGDIFESETILSPVDNISIVGENIDNINEWLREKGLFVHYLVFHIGGNSYSAINLNNMRYIVLSADNLKKIAEYASFDDWYTALKSEVSDLFVLK